jgi:glycosyltransferase involved in cell wall biosynthesis
VSHFNARELEALSGRQAEVIPVLFDRQALPAPPDRSSGPPGPPTVLFVGRLVPHKRQDLIIRTFARFRRRQPDAQLVLVGMPLSPDYGAKLQGLAEELAPGAVSFHAGVSAEQLAEHYRRAHAFFCLSEHEGFCIPLLEAFHYGVPVIARDAGAIAEVVGDAGLLLSEQDNLQTAAELLAIVVHDPELRAELRARGQRRLELYGHQHAARQLHDALDALSAS